MATFYSKKNQELVLSEELMLEIYYCIKYGGKKSLVENYVFAIEPVLTNNGNILCLKVSKEQEGDEGSEKYFYAYSIEMPMEIFKAHCILIEQKISASIAKNISTGVYYE